MTNIIITTFATITICFAPVFTHSINKTLYGLGHSPKSNLTNIIFPSVDTNKNHESSHNRPPLYNISCHESEFLYPGDHEGDWVCDCKPGFLHYPLTNECYEAHTQGPCNHNQIITLPKTSSIPECVVNRCPQKQVYFNGQCFPLSKEDGCAKYKDFTGRKIFLLVDATSLGLICADEEFKYECIDDCCKPRQPKPDFKDICLNMTSIERDNPRNNHQKGIQVKQVPGKE